MSVVVAVDLLSSMSSSRLFEMQNFALDIQNYVANKDKVRRTSKNFHMCLHKTCVNNTTKEYTKREQNEPQALTYERHWWAGFAGKRVKNIKKRQYKIAAHKMLNILRFHRHNVHFDVMCYGFIILGTSTLRLM